MSDSYNIQVKLRLSKEAANALFRIMETQGDLDLSKALSDAVILQDLVARALAEGHEVLCRMSDGNEVPVTPPVTRPRRVSLQ